MNTNTTSDLKKADAAQAEALDERATVTPAVDIYENKDEILLIADMPGVAPEGLKLNLEKMELTLEGKRLKAEIQGKPVAAELGHFDFRRTFRIPQGIAADQIAAELSNGILRIHLPKAPGQKPRQIPIRSN